MDHARRLAVRNEKILARYADGGTLREIGDELGLSGEAIRLIVKKHGGAGAEDARAARQQARERDLREKREAFMETFRMVAEELAHQGATRAAAVSRIVTLFPDTDPTIADDALRESDIVFDYDNGTDTFSDLALEAGVWFLLASELRLAPDRQWAAVHLPQSLLEELSSHLIETNVTPGELASILGKIAAAQRISLEDSSLTITGGRYNELRGELLDAMGLKSAKGTKPWPPTRQTIQKRYGGWNDALISMGLSTANKGRQKGLLSFSEADYTNAVADFISHSEASMNEQTFANYGLWVKKEFESGTRRPSPASIRNFYGAWLPALRKASQPARA